jgi:plastocyanin
MLLLCLVAAGCSGLAHPVSNDGSDGSSFNAPRTPTITAMVVNSDIAVGDTETVVVTMNGTLLANNGLLTVTSSDSTVVRVGGTQFRGISVGSAILTATYSGYQATQGISVHPAASGASATTTIVNTTPPAFSPALLKINPGASVAFSVGPTHNVQFDGTPGAPANISVGGNGNTVLRTFTTAGSFAFQCTIHGEIGVVNVVP